MSAVLDHHGHAHDLSLGLEQASHAPAVKDAHHDLRGTQVAALVHQDACPLLHRAARHLDLELQGPLLLNMLLTGKGRAWRFPAEQLELLDELVD